MHLSILIIQMFDIIVIIFQLFHLLLLKNFLYLIQKIKPNHPYILNKIKQKQQVGDTQFLRGNVVIATYHYQFCIEVSPLFDQRPFQGLGNIQDQEDYYFHTVLEWAKKSLIQQTITGCVYDCLAICINARENYTEIKPWFQSMLKKYPQNYQLHYGLGNILYSLKNYKEAEEQYKKVVELNPSFDKSYQLIGYIQSLRNGNLEAALVWATKALEINPNNLYSKLLYADCQSNNKKRIAQLSQLLLEHKEYPRTYFWLGLAYQDEGNKIQALKWYQENIKINPSYPLAYLGAGTILKQQKKYQQALQYLSKAYQLNPTSCEPLEIIGAMYQQNGNFEEAIACFKRAVVIDPKKYNSILGVGRCLIQANQLDKAIQWLKRSIQANPQQLRGYLKLASVYSKKQNYDEAIKLYQKCIELKPKNCDLYDILIEHYALAQRQQEGLRCYEECLSIDPNFTLVDTNYYFFSEIYNRRGQYQNAINFLVQAIEAKLTNCWYYKCLAELYEKLGDVDQAKRVVHKAWGYLGMDQELTNEEIDQVKDVFRRIDSIHSQLKNEESERLIKEEEKEQKEKEKEEKEKEQEKEEQEKEEKEEEKEEVKYQGKQKYD